MAWATGPLPHCNPTCSCESAGSSWALHLFVLRQSRRLPTSTSGLWSRVATRPWGGRQGSRDLVQPDCPLPTAWQQVEQQLGGGPAGESSPRPVQYVERTPNPRLQSEPSPTLRETPLLSAIVTWVGPAGF